MPETRSKKAFWGLKLDRKLARGVFSAVSAGAPEAPIGLDRKMLQRLSSGRRDTRLERFRSGLPRIGPKPFSRRFATVRRRFVQRVALQWPRRPFRGILVRLAGGVAASAVASLRYGRHRRLG